MEKPSWSEGLEIGVAAIDAEHRLLVDLVKALEDALALGAPRERAGEVLEQLLDYTRGHFLAESLLMRLHAYPDYQAHVQEHDRLLEHLEQASRSFRGGFSLSLELVSALQQWLSEHIRTTDKSFAAYLAASGAAA